MRTLDALHDHNYCLRQAAELLTGPVRAFTLDVSVERLLRPRLRLELRRGLAMDAAILQLQRGPRGKTLELGLERYRLPAALRPIRLVRVMAPETSRYAPWLYDFWVVAEDQYAPLYRAIRRLERTAEPHLAPIMHDADRQRLWDNSLGFLLRGQDTLRRYGVPRKRGVLLCGEPGNGKTMACRWLFAQCNLRGFRWRNVSPQDYQIANANGEVHELFGLDGPGIILFDDFDEALRSRDEVGPSHERTTFLTQLDGLEPRDGVVFLFASNARLARMDPAFRRPGRIDLVIHFPRPDAELRRRLVQDCWHAELTDSIGVDCIVAGTQGCSFAELEELKKLLVLGFLDHGRWLWHEACETFRASRNDGEAATALGFHAPRPNGLASVAR